MFFTTKIRFILIALSIFLLGEGCTNKVKEQNHLRIGWQVPWALQGQLVQVLKNTDILKKNEIDAEFTGFQFGAPLNEAALSGGVDVVLTADQPAITLISKDPDWIIISRLMYNRVALYVPPKSPIKALADLKGKTVGMPFGAAAQRVALKAESDAGLDPEKDVKNVNLGIYEQSDLVKDSAALKWGSMDALAGFDPTPAIFQVKNLVNILFESKVVSVVVMKKSFIEKNPALAGRLILSLQKAYEYYRQHTEQADKWFTDEAKLSIPMQALKIANKMEPNLALATTKINLSFTENDYTSMQEAADFLFNKKMIAKPIKIKEHINLSYLEKAIGQKP